MSAIHFHRWYEYHRTLSAFSEPVKQTAKVHPSYHPPLIDEEQREYMGFLLEEAHELERPVLVTYAGRFSPLQFYGRIVKVQPYEGWFVIANGEWKKRIAHPQLIDVDWL
ncbi:YolD-like family protein [Laceyella putida]|uniref:YolD-like family protein n=1 Tax=Laceyella putida TaxID=110101 RepID=A0ABW2RGA7_9BACL